MMKIEIQNLQDLTNISKNLQLIASILESQEKSKSKSNEDIERLAELEIKVKKLWSLLTEQTPAGKDKLSRYGKTFQGGFNGRN